MPDLLDQLLENEKKRVQAADAHEQQYVPEKPIDYDRASRIFEVQAKTRLPSEVIDADLDNLWDQVSRDQFDRRAYTDLVNGSPIFNEFALSDPYHPAVIERDRERLTLMERAFQGINLGIKKGDAMIELSRISNRRRAGDKREGDEEVMEDLRSLTAREHFGLESEFIKVLIATATQGVVQTHLLGESWELAAGSALIGASSAAVAGAVGPQVLVPEELITVPAAAGIGLAVGWRTGVFSAAQKLEQGLAYDEYVQLGLPENEAKVVSGAVGGVNAALEMVGINAIVKNFPGARQIQGQLGKTLVERTFSRPTMRGALARLVGRVGESTATEVVTEIMQESTTIAGGEILKSRARERGDFRPETAPMTWNQFVDAVGNIALETLRGTILLSSIGPGASFYSDTKRAIKARGDGALFKALGEAAEGAEIRTKVPGKYREFLQAQQEKGPIQEIRFDSEAWEQYWTGQGLDVNEVNAELGLQPMEIYQETGADVVVSLETFGEKIAPTEHFNNELWKDARLRPGDMTQREARSFFANPEEHVERLKKELGEMFGVDVSDDFDRIVNDITGQLLALNYDRVAAEQQARLTATVFTTQALRNPQAGVTPWELYQQRLAGIRRDIRDVETAPPGAFDPAVDPMLDRIRAGNFPTQREMHGLSLVEFVVARGGIQDQGGELSARDFQRVRIGLVNSKGDTLDGMAETAAEAGYIPERDPDMLLAALDREVGGQPVYAPAFESSDLIDLNADLNALAEYLETEGIDIENMSNQQIREQLNNRTRFEQTDDDTLKDLSDLIMTTLSNELSDQFADDIASLAKRLPLVADDQELGDLEFVDRVRKGDRTGTRRQRAQRVFDQAVKKRNMLKTLMDCMGG